MVLEAAKGCALAVAAAVLGGVGDVMEGIILVGAAGATLGWFYARVLRPGVGALLRVHHGVGVLEQLPGFMERTDARMAEGSDNFRLIEERLALLEADLSDT